MDPLLAAVLAAAIAVVGIVVGYAVAGQRQPTAVTVARPPRAPVAPEPVTRAIAMPPTADRRPLINTLIGAYDTSGEESVRAYIAQQLGAAGVTAVNPEPGRSFEAATARCVATEVVPGAEPGSVVRVERPGWQDASGPIRMPEVTVAAQPDRG